MSSKQTHHVPLRMQKPLQHAMSQPRRDTSAFKVDPNWKNKLAAGQRKQMASGLVEPQKTSSTFGGGMGYAQRHPTNGYVMTSNRNGSLGGKSRNSGFDKQAFLHAQQRGDFRKKNTRIRSAIAPSIPI